MGERKSYTLTDNTKKQVKELRALLSDGRTMSVEDIEKALNRKWVNGVIHHLEDDLEKVKDGRRILGYRLKDATGNTDVVSRETLSVSSESVAAASVPRRKARVAVESNTVPVETDTASDVTYLDTVKSNSTPAPAPLVRKNVVREARPEKPYEPRVLKTNWPEKVMSDDGIDLTLPKFLRRT